MNESPLSQEARLQSQEPARAKNQLRDQQEQLETLKRELEDTNRGVVALYAELDERADYLRRASESKSSFLSHVSHELRTPLNAIMGLTSLLLDRVDGDLQAEQEKQVNLIRQAAESLRDLVNDLLDLAKVEAGRVTIRAELFEIDNLFGTLRGMLKPLLAEPSRVALIFDLPDGVRTLCTDEGKVAQILRNFISNAIKFTEYGEIRVSARLQENGCVEFCVADSGIGIAETDQAIVFDEFAQIDTPLHGRYRGTGLGLPLARKLAGLLGGSVRVQSTSGCGTRFYAVLPCVYRGAAELETRPHNVAPERSDQ